MLNNVDESNNTKQTGNRERGPAADRPVSTAPDANVEINANK